MSLGLPFDLPGPSVCAIEQMASLLLRRVLYAQLAWTHSDEHSPEASLALVRTSQRTYEAFLRKYGLLHARE